MFTQALGVGSPASGWLGQFRYLADTQGLTTSAGRHPDADLIVLANSSYRSLREHVIALGYRQFCTRGTTTALPTTAVETGETYATITLAQGVSQIAQFDVRPTNGEWISLPEIQITQLRDYSTRQRTTPRAWLWLDAGSVALAAFTAGKLGVLPVPNGGSYALWTVNEFTDLASATDVYLYHTEDWKLWHMYHTMAKICGARDKDTARKLDFILSQLNEDTPSSPAKGIYQHAPVTAGPRTWTRSRNYRGIGPWG